MQFTVASIKRVGLGILTIASISLPAQTRAQVVLLDNTANTIQTAFTVWSGQSIAQGFQMGSQGATLTTVTLPLNGSSGASGFTVGLYSDSAGVPGTELATLSGSSAPATVANFDYTGSFSLLANSKYWVVASSTGSGVTWPFTEVAGNSGPATLLSSGVNGGGSTAWVTSGSLWQELRITAVPEPTQTALATALGLAVAAIFLRRRPQQQ